MNEFTGLLIGFILSLFIYSYVIGDNPLYRLAIHILVGVSAAYAAVIATRQVLLPVYEQMSQNPGGVESLLWLVPILFTLLLILKQLPTLAWMGNNTLALLIGVGAAVALVGALIGTLWPQVTAVTGPQTTTLFPYQEIVVALLTIATLLSFQFTGRVNAEGAWSRPIWQQGIAQLGRAVLMITFGALFASLLNTSLVLLTERISFFLNQFLQLLT